MTKPYVIVVGTDFSEHAAQALRVAFEHAASHTPAELHVVHASIVAAADGLAGETLPGQLTSPAMSGEEQHAALVRHLETQLAKSPDFPNAGVDVQAHVLLDAPGFALTSLAQELKADLLVVGSHGRRGVVRLLLGSVAEAVVRQASCPVLVVPVGQRLRRAAEASAAREASR